MDISKYVAELLFDFECVVIPGLGGFIANDKPATINRINHQFKPPFRTILFNRHVKANDGLLVNQMATSEGISFEKARREIDRFVEATIEQLENGQTVTFSKIGSLSFDNQKNFIFEQDVSVNYNPEAYGLTGFVSSPVKRVTDEEKLRNLIIPKRPDKSKPVDRKPEIIATEKSSRKKRTSRIVVLVAGIIIIVFGFVWGLTNQSKVNQYWTEATFAMRQLSPDLKIIDKQNVINEARYIPRKLIESDKEILEKIKRSETLTENDETPKQVTAEAESEVKPSVENKTIEVEENPVRVPENEVTGPLYYIIAGSFSNAKNANYLVSELKAKGYDAKIADTNSTGMYRVAYTGIKALKLAKEKLYAIRQDDNPEAWLLRK